MADVEMGTLDSPNAQLMFMQEMNRDFVEEKISTSIGTIAVYVVGDRKRPAIVTYHDLGLNSNSCFQSFFQFSEMTVISDKFCIYHINAPGQEEDAEPFPDNFIYPSMDDLAESVANVVDHFGIKSFLGFGVGAGANVLSRYTLKHPKKLDSLVLVNCAPFQAGWIEWGYQKANVYYLKNRGMTTLTVDYLMWHHFGRNLDQYNTDLINSYKQYFARLPNPKNLAGFIETYVARTDLNLSRDGATLECPVLQIVGAGSPHTNDTVEMNARLPPTNSNWLKVSDSSGLVLEEKPEKVTEAVMLFLQGQGYFPTMSHLKWRQQSQSRSNSVNYSRSNSLYSPVDPSGHSGITEESEMHRRSHSIATPENNFVRTIVEQRQQQQLASTKEIEENSGVAVA